MLNPTIPKNHHKWSWMGWIPTIPKWWVYCWVAHIKTKNSIQFWQKCCFGFVQPSPIFASVPHYKSILLCQVPQVMLNWPDVFDQIYVRLHQNEEKKQTVRAIQRILKIVQGSRSPLKQQIVCGIQLFLRTRHDKTTICFASWPGRLELHLVQWHRCWLWRCQKWSRACWALKWWLIGI